MHGVDVEGMQLGVNKGLELKDCRVLPQRAAAQSSWCTGWTWRACSWASMRSSYACSGPPRRCLSPTPAASAPWWVSQPVKDAHDWPSVPPQFTASYAEGANVSWHAQLGADERGGHGHFFNCCVHGWKVCQWGELCMWGHNENRSWCEGAAVGPRRRTWTG